jgi:hypothetical protein
MDLEGNRIIMVEGKGDMVEEGSKNGEFEKFMLGGSAS